MERTRGAQRRLESQGEVVWNVEELGRTLEMWNVRLGNGRGS